MNIARTPFGLLAGAGFAALLWVPSIAFAQVAPPLGVAQQFGALGNSGVTGAAGSGVIVSGDVGSSPTPAISNFPPSSTVPPFIVHNTGVQPDGVVQQARTDALVAYNFLAAQGPGTVLPAQLNGAVLTSGIYSFAGGAADLAALGTLTLNGPGVFVFQVDSALTANVGSTVTGTADPCNVFWRVGTSATLNGNNFWGTVIADASITLGSANLVGRMLAGTGPTGAVTMAGAGGNTIRGCTRTFSTQASSGVTLGGAISDTATLSGGATPTGTITFNLYGPNDATCTGAAIFTPTVPVSGNGNYGSGPFIPLLAGTYRWIANYSGDTNNAGTASACNAANENVVVALPGLAIPTLITQASPGVTLGAAISDTATLSGGVSPTGTITFTLYGPNNAACTGVAIFTATVPVSGNGIYASGPFTPTLAGTYRWIANYSGDANNAATANTCNAANENVDVARLTPVLTTQASAAVAFGGGISDTATLSGGASPTGTITFTLYGPNNVACTGVAIFTSTVAVSGNGNYVSGSFTPVLPGLYRWIANYSGDANNAGTANACNAPNESVVVLPVGLALTTLSTQASAGVTLGGAISDTATLSGGATPTGTITFTLFGPNDATCTGAAIFTSTVPVSGNGNYVSGPFTPALAGTYRWIANYSGDANNASTANACNAPNENVVVAPVGGAITTLTTQASPAVALGGAISDTATLSGGATPTGTITFNLYGPNDATCTGAVIFTSTVPVTGNGAYPSTSFTPTTAGTYRWIANYSGDANNAGTANACNAPNENVVVGPAAAAAIPTLSEWAMIMLAALLVLFGVAGIRRRAM